MRAKAIEDFDGVKDGDVLPTSFKVGDAVSGDLAATAVRHGHAEEIKGPEGLEAFTVQQLRDLAAERGIDLGDATRKADIVAAIELADEQRAGAGD